MGLALLAAAPAPASTQRPADEATTPRRVARQRTENPSRSARRILHLRGGATLRGVARLRDGSWEIKTKEGWTPLEPGSVLRQAREADVLRDRKNRAKEVEQSADLDDRVAFAEWMIDEGLLEEGVQELDRVLEASPHHPGALGLIRRRRPLAAAVPSPEVALDGLEDARTRLEPLLAWASDRPTTAREEAILELGRLEDREALEGVLLAGLGAQAPRRRSFCAHALGRLFPGHEVQRLMQHAVLDASREVRVDAARALHTADEPGLVLPIVRALNSTNPRVRAQSAEALGHMGYAAAVEPLMTYLTSASQPGSANRVPHGYIFIGRQYAYVQDFDVEVATFQAVADPQINTLLEGSVLEAGVVGVVEYDYVTEMRAARGALGQLTGENPGRTARAWKSWWEEHAAEWRLRVPAERDEK